MDLEEKVVVVGGSYHSVVTASSSYRESPQVKQKTPQEVISEFFTENDLPRPKEIPDELSKMNRKQRRGFYKQFRKPKEWRGLK